MNEVMTTTMIMMTMYSKPITEICEVAFHMHHRYNYWTLQSFVH